MILKVEAIVLSLPELVVVIIKGLLGEADFGCSSLKRIDPLTFLVNHFVELSPIVYKLIGFPDGSFFDFFLRLGVGCAAAFLRFGIGGDIPISDFDGTVEKEFIFEVNYLFEGELSDVYVKFP
jgi:hypothetical protein